MRSELINRAREYAIKVHAEANHRYDIYPYSYHLSMVTFYTIGFVSLLPIDRQEAAIGAAWCHDAIEDARQTYNDVKAATSEEVADIVYALTNDKGKTRSERAGLGYYRGIRHQGDSAILVKVCDRLANVEYSRRSGSSMVKKYADEMPTFFVNLYIPAHAPLWERLFEKAGVSFNEFIPLVNSKV